MRELVRITLAAVLAVDAWTGGPAVAAPDSSDAPAERPRIGLVLSGGGARGAAHVGVLEVLEELRIPVDCIVGTSMGSIVGGLYASGMSPADLRVAITETDWVSVFKDRPDRDERYFRRKQDDIEYPVRYRLYLDEGTSRLPLGVLQAQRLSNRLERFEETMDAVDDFDRLPIPFRAVATDLDSGEPLVIKDGSLALALRASMSIPGVFRPVSIDGRLYVDGGVVANLPVGIMQSEFDVDVVIAVDISTPLREKDLESAVAVVRRMLRFLTQGNVARDRERLGPHDLLLVPDLDGITTADFARSGEAIDLGRTSAEAAAERLARLSVSEGEYRRFLESQRRAPQEPPVIAAVTVDEPGPLRPGIVQAFVTQPLGQPLNPDRLEEDLVRLHGMGIHDPVAYSVIDDGADGEPVLHVSAPRRRLGLASLQFGLEIEDDFEGGNNYTLSARHQRLAVNRRGGEWQSDFHLGDTSGLESEFYQPLDRRLRYYVAAGVAWTRENEPVTLDGQPVALIEFTEWGAILSIGRNLGTWGQLEAGVVRGVGAADVAIGDSALELDRVSLFREMASLRVDTLDSASWPSRGGIGSVEWRRSTESLGGETDDESLQAGLDWAWSIGRTRFVPGFELGLDLGDTGQFGAGFSLGGLFRLSGYGPLELIGNESVLGRLVSYRRLNRKVLPALPAGAYVGLSLEAGNVFAVDQSIDGSDLLFGGSVFLGADTPLGPMLFGIGYTDPDRRRFYLSFGRSLFGS